MSIGMNAINNHKEPSEEMKKIWKKNGSLTDYQNKPHPKKKKENIREELDYINRMFL